MDTRIRKEASGSYVLIGVSIVAGIFALVAGAVVLKEAFALMSRKSDFDVFLGITMIALLIACFAVLLMKVYRVFSGKNAQKNIDRVQGEDHNE